jgi:hypothetical protein
VATEVSELTEGVEVEVRTRFTANWAPAFEVVRVAGDRVHVRRRSDGAVLPVALSLHDVRRARTAHDRNDAIMSAGRHRG